MSEPLFVVELLSDFTFDLSTDLRLISQSFGNSLYHARMGIASTPTKLPLATFAKIAGFHPLHFEQIEFTPEGESPSTCGAGMLQYDWQAHDRVSRESIATQIAEAEAMMEQTLKWHLIPSWDADEWKQTQRPNLPELWHASIRDVRGLNASVPATWSKIISGGIEAKTLIEAASQIVWTVNGNTGRRTGSTTSPVAAGVQACEVEVYYPGHGGAAGYQIRPATVDIVAGIATITFARELCVSEDMLEAMSPQPADYADDANFLVTVDVYRHYNDPSTQAVAMWQPGGCGNCEGNGCVQCSYSVQNGCLTLRSTPDLGVLSWTPGNWNAATAAYDLQALSANGQPDLLRLYYYSGNRASTGCPRVMDSQWANAVTYLALSGLERPICDCSADVWEYWREDLALTSGGEQFKTYAAFRGDDSRNSPFGTRRGALYSWRRVTERNVATVRSGTLTS